MTEVLLNEVTTRFLNIEDNNIFAESTLSDPRFKRHGFYNEFSYGRACTNLKHLVANVILQSQAEILIENPVETVIAEPLTKKNVTSGFDREIDEIIKNTNPTAEERRKRLSGKKHIMILILLLLLNYNM
ncbi:unnamed protein product [Pieris macdunnoughi]|uniref:Uncharacterized protein n=1 Tax=Pieris macdunnoughi TaxID=345717 RepID=A0A821UM20_9NEOP|nr:unnamed protein product [Pieris macdunnoughi]